MTQPALTLASKSPRRAELLKQMGLQFEVRSADIDEAAYDLETAEVFVLRMALEKARVSAGDSAGIVMGADTIVELDGDILGKPRDEAASIEMLLRLSGRSHRVLTGVAVLKEGLSVHRVVSSTVWFREIDRALAKRYWDSGEPKDKAGSYGIQGLGGIFVEHLEGSYSNVMGLPIFETAQLLATKGVRVL